MSQRLIAFILCFLFLSIPLAHSKKLHKRSLVKKQVKLEKHFDLNKDKKLSLHEKGLIRTYKRFEWHLARTKVQKLYDLNHDGMLQPFEYKQYKEKKKIDKRLIK